MKKLLLLFIVISLISNYNLNAQGISINEDGSDADGSAMLDVKSSDKGFLPPRMTEAQRDDISSPAAGLVVWCSDCGDNGDLQVFNGTAWGSMNAGAVPFTCGDLLIDDRDDQAYRTTLIGNQCWMAENLNYDQSAFGSYWCYEDNSAYCNFFGHLYDWATVMRGFASSNNNPSSVQGVCPNGWHVPSRVEWDELESYVGNDFLDYEGTALKSMAVWLNQYGTPNYGTDNFGFTALPGGIRLQSSFAGTGSFSAWWSSTENQDQPNTAWYRTLSSSNTHFNELNFTKAIGLSVRCLRD